MSVFFRWGVFGIIAVAALIYVYNASKHLSERRASPPATVASSEAEEQEASPAEEEEEEEAEEVAAAEALPDMPEPCVEEQQVAERALKMRRDGEPLDRLLRIDLIVLQSDAKRGERLQAVATRWFERAGRDPDSAGLRAEVLRDCRRALAVSPAP